MREARHFVPLRWEQELTIMLHDDVNYSLMKTYLDEYIVQEIEAWNVAPVDRAAVHRLLTRDIESTARRYLNVNPLSQDESFFVYFSRTVTQRLTKVKNPYSPI